MANKTRAYGIGKPFKDVFPVPIIASRAPTTSDTGYEIGQIWTYPSDGRVWILAKVASGSATWSVATADSGGDLTVSNDLSVGNDLSVTGDSDVGGDLAISGAGKQLQVEGGAATDFIGQAILVSGTVTVANTNIAAADKIFVQREGVAASTALGVLDVSITAATSFTITALQPGTPGSTETNDVSVVNYFIVRQL